MPTIHGAGLSPFVRKVRVVMTEKGLPYELNPVTPFAPPANWKTLSPLGKIPVYQDGDFTVADSSVICAYLERKHPSPPMYPKNDEDWARALFLEEYADTKLIEANAPIFFQRILRAKLMKQTPDEDAVKKAEEAQPVVFDWLESKAPDGEGIVGGRFSIADVAIASPFVNLQHAGGDIDAKRWPKLAAYVARVHARPSFKALIEEERKLLAGL
jgi:glutathione S-transferase